MREQDAALRSALWPWLIDEAAAREELRRALEGQGLSVWVDSRQLRGGSKLAAEIEAAIEFAKSSPEPAGSAALDHVFA